jgi:isopentenyl diphosphate isomerase/L-lactate dehydrogenase-like FMN-dependent dehydrogenase
MIMFENIQFVHCALPDMSLNEIDVSIKLADGVALKSPLAVEAESQGEAKALSASNEGILFLANSSGSRAFFLNGSELPSLQQPPGFQRVGDGLEAAKCLRAKEGAMPSIGAAGVKDIDTFTKQLKIAMFLTNSRNIEELRKAPIYHTSDGHA